MRAVSGAPPAAPAIELTPAVVHDKRPSVRPSMDREDEDRGDEDDEDDDTNGALIRGGSQPPFRTDPPPLNFPPTPLVPRLDPERAEKVETLSLPAGLESGGPPEDLPSSPLEARIYFSHLARELGWTAQTPLAEGLAATWAWRSAGAP